MNKNTLAMLLMISTTAVSFSALAQDSSQPAPALSSSTIANCTSYISNLAKDGNNGDLSALAPQALQTAITAAAGGNSSDLTLCYQANACKDQLSSQPNCARYLALWNWYNTTPAIVKPQGTGGFGSTLAPTTGSTQPSANNPTASTQMKASDTPTTQTNGTGNQGATPAETDPKKKQPGINWL